MLSRRRRIGTFDSFVDVNTRAPRCSRTIELTSARPMPSRAVLLSNDQQVDEWTAVEMIRHERESEDAAVALRDPPVASGEARVDQGTAPSRVDHDSAIDIDCRCTADDELIAHDRNVSAPHSHVATCRRFARQWITGPRPPRGGGPYFQPCKNTRDVTTRRHGVSSRPSSGATRPSRRSACALPCKRRHTTSCASRLRNVTSNRCRAHAASCLATHAVPCGVQVS
jgi:hypothetical protein